VTLPITLESLTMQDAYCGTVNVLKVTPEYVPSQVVNGVDAVLDDALTETSAAAATANPSKTAIRLRMRPPRWMTIGTLPGM
jgi:hypothetical protein